MEVKETRLNTKSVNPSNISLQTNPLSKGKELKQMLEKTQQRIKDSELRTTQHIVKVSQSIDDQIERLSKSMNNRLLLHINSLFNSMTQLESLKMAIL